MEKIEIVKQLKLCNYQCEAGPLEKNTAFIELEKMAQKELEAEPSTSTNTAMLQLLCSIDKYLDETNCDVEPGDPFHTKIKAVLAQQQHS